MSLINQCQYNRNDIYDDRNNLEHIVSIYNAMSSYN